MRRILPAFLGLCGLSLLAAVPSACTEKIIVTKAAAPPGEEPPPEEEPTPDAGPPAPVDPLLVDLGTVRTGADVSFEIPEGALGFNITAEGEIADFDPNSPFGIERIVDPSGKVVHDDFTPKGGTKSTSVAAFDAIAAASVPQSEAVSKVLPAGTWKVRFGVEGQPSAKVDLKGLVRVQSSGDGVFHGGTLDLHLHIPQGLNVDGSTVDPKKASSNAALKERVETFFAVTSEALGIERGEVVFHPEAASLADLDDNEIFQGFAVSAGTKDGTQSLHVLITNSIRADGQPIAAGIAPGIPGAANLYGRNVSGIIVASMGSSDQDVLTMLHEMGHFIGLNHTTEMDGQSADPLDDTPRCSGIEDGALELCPDLDNVMFPTGSFGQRLKISATQKRVYQGSPIYKAMPVGTQKTQSRKSSAPMPDLRRRFRASGLPLTPVESELSLGFCGLNKLDAAGIVKRHGPGTVTQLRAAANDPDLSTVIRGRAALALKALGAQP